MKQEEITDEFFKDVKIYFVSPHKGGNPHLLIFKKWNPNINKCLKNVVKKSNITYIEEGEYSLVKRRSAIQININGDCFRYAWQSKNCFFYRFYKSLGVIINPKIKELKDES